MGENLKKVGKSPDERARARRRLRYKLIGLVIAMMLWRVYANYDRRVSLLESFTSGMILLIVGWYCAVVILRLRKTITGLLSKIYLWLGISTVCVNIFVMEYYLQRWFLISRLDERTIPSEVGFIIWVAFYCSVLWLTNYVKEMSEDYGFR